MRVTTITALRGRMLHCTDCGRWCRVSALRAGDHRCPACERGGLVVAGTGGRFAPEPGPRSG